MNEEQSQPIQKKNYNLKIGIVILVILIGIYFGYTSFYGDKTTSEGNWYPYEVEVWNTAFDLESKRTNLEYTPLNKASKKWDICASFPHMKDSYWLAVNYGIADESKRLGVGMNLFHAGGYDNLITQIEQIKGCVDAGADAVIIGAISYDGLNDLVSELKTRDIPVIDVINGISSKEISAKSLVSFKEMGYLAGKYVSQAHPKGSSPTKVAWFPGPEEAGWVIAGDEGFKQAIEDSSVEIVATKYGDTGKTVQSLLIYEILDEFPDIEYIIGTAVTADVATTVLEERGMSDRIKVISYYFTPEVYEGILQHDIEAAPTDSSVIQGRIAVDQAVRILENKEYEKHVGPKLYIIDNSNINTFDRDTSLAPENFVETFIID